MLDILGVELDATLSSIEPGCLIVANHISWLDIVVLNAARPVAFVSKSEVRHWPLIGWLAMKAETVFLRRGSRGHARLVNAEIDALLNAGKDVAVFPEGTTTDGTHLLGFHGALLQAAVETGRPIVPMALSYETPEGQHSLAPAYVGETSLLQSLNAVLDAGGIVARLRPGAALQTPGRNRRELTQAARQAIAVKLGLLPANMSPETPADPQGEPPSGGDPKDSPNQAPTSQVRS